jgi:hypothetical protein
VEKLSHRKELGGAYEQGKGLLSQPIIIILLNMYLLIGTQRALVL